MVQLAIILCVLAIVVALVVACMIAAWIYHRSPGGRLSAIAAWNAPDTPIVCADCNGMGIVTFGKDKIGTSPGELAHAVWAGGNNRTCRACLGRGFVRSGWAKPVLPTLIQPNEEPGEP